MKFQSIKEKMAKPRPQRENRVIIAMSDSEIEQVDDWRFANRVGSRSEAIRRLIRIAVLFDRQGGGAHHKLKQVTNDMLTMAAPLADVLIDSIGSGDPGIEKAKRLLQRFHDLMVHTGRLADAVEELIVSTNAYRRAGGFSDLERDAQNMVRALRVEIRLTRERGQKMAREIAAEAEKKAEERKTAKEGEPK